LTNGCIVYTAGCQTGCTTRVDNRVERTVCSLNTVVKPVVQPVVSCKRGISIHMVVYSAPEIKFQIMSTELN